MERPGTPRDFSIVNFFNQGGPKECEPLSGTRRNEEKGWRIEGKKVKNSLTGLNGRISESATDSISEGLRTAQV